MLKKSGERRIIASITLGQTEQQQKLGNRNWMKNNFMDISNNKLAKYHIRRLWNGYEKKISSEKSNILK